MSVDTALALIGGLTLPDGRAWRDVWPADPWIERDVIRPILARDDAGQPLHRMCWVELSRGHQKTNAVAAVAIAEALSEHSTEVVCLAADLDQARLVIDAIAGQCFRNPKLGAAFRQGKDEFVVRRNRSTIKVYASDAPSFYGIGVGARRLRIVCDELTQWPTRAMFDAALSTMPKVTDSQMIVITNAGIVGSWQEEARAAFAEAGYLFAAPGIIASWIKQEDIDRLRLPGPVRRRYFGNEWTLSAGDFITEAMLRACVDEDWEPQWCGREAYTIGLDLGLTHDRTVRAVCHYDDDTQAVVLDALRVWEGTRDNPVSIAAVEADLIRCNELFDRPSIICDPWQLKGSLERMRGQLDIREYAFSGPSVMKLSETLYSLISAGNLRLFPDKELEMELLRLQVKQTAVGWRIDHQAGGFSDRAIALGLAALGAVERGGRKTTWEWL